jgi:ABC-type antimicrobial peptide transport system permease subunit
MSTPLEYFIAYFFITFVILMGLVIIGICVIAGIDEIKFRRARRRYRLARK